MKSHERAAIDFSQIREDFVTICPFHFGEKI